MSKITSDTPTILPLTLMGQKAIVENASKELIIKVNKYANLAYAAGQELGNEPARIRYAINVINEMVDRCDTPEERLTASLKNFI